MKRAYINNICTAPKTDKCAVIFLPFWLQLCCNSLITRYLLPPVDSGDKYRAADVWKDFIIVEGNVDLNEVISEADNAEVTGL